MVAEEAEMTPRVKVLVLHMDSCKQCIRLRQVTNEHDHIETRCYGDPFRPRTFTEAEKDALRDGDILPRWCPLPDAEPEG